MEELMNNEESMEMVAEEVAKKLPVKGGSNNLLWMGCGALMGIVAYPIGRWIKKSLAERKAKKTAKECEPEVVEVQVKNEHLKETM